MVAKQKKTGKGRLDKYYHLAKDEGYRARSAYKLIQIAKKFDFLKKANSCVDLCGAPGGWSQVALKQMPRGSKVICVDLAPIQPLKGVVTFQCDITTARCRDLLRKELKDDGKDKKRRNLGTADVVLNDGAPNVGADWGTDAFNQLSLSLKALELACDMLPKNGTFVTKVFRSKHYTQYLWAAKQLFKRVEVVKPSSSRDVSAEIFLVCLEYKAPEKIDPKFFDPKHLFNEEEEDEDDESGPKGSSEIINEHIKNQKRRKRGGYTQDNFDRNVSVMQFLFPGKANPASVLVGASRFFFPVDADKIESSALSTPEIKSLMKDIQVLGKGDLMALLKWRFKILRDLFPREKKDRAVEKASKEASEKDVDTELQEQISKKKAEEKADKKRLKEKKMKSDWRKKMSMGTFPQGGNIFEPDLFQMEDIQMLQEQGEDIEEISRLEEEEEEDEDVDSDLENVIPKGGLYIEDGDEEERRKDLEEDMDEKIRLKKELASQNKLKSAAREKKGKKETRRQKVLAEWTQEMQNFSAGLEKKAEDAHWKRERRGEGEEDDDDSVHSDSGNNPFVTGDFYGEDADKEKKTLKVKKARKVEVDDDFEVPKVSSRDESQMNQWFDQDIFEGKELGEEDIPQLPLTEKQRRKEKRKKELLKKEKREAKKKGDNEDEPEGDDKNFELAPASSEAGVDLSHFQSNFERPEDPEELAETLALGHHMVTSRKGRMEVIEAGYNRFAYNDDEDDLPEWFVEEEKKFTKPELPVTRELMQEYNAKLREISQRPIRKVAEASARKKKKMAAQLEKVRKTAKSLAAAEDLNPRTKAKTVASAMSKIKEAQKRKALTIASSARGGPGKMVSKMTRKQAENAKVKVVDKRMKSDKRGERKAIKKIKKRGGKIKQNVGLKKKKGGRK